MFFLCKWRARKQISLQRDNKVVLYCIEKEAEKNWHRRQLRKVFYLSGSDLRCNRLDSDTCNRWPGRHRSLRSDRDCCHTRWCLWGVKLTHFHWKCRIISLVQKVRECWTDGWIKRHLWRKMTHKFRMKREKKEKRQNRKAKETRKMVLPVWQWSPL